MCSLLCLSAPSRAPAGPDSMRSPDRDASGHTRLAVVGNKAVGKTALIVRYLTKRFIGEYQSDTDMMYKAMTPLDGGKVALEILDLSSNPDGFLFPRHVLTWAEAWVVVYSITCEESFRAARRAIEAVVSAGGGGGGGSEVSSAPLLLVANKKDLEHMRQVPEKEGRRLADFYGCRFVEVSAAEMVAQVNDPIDCLLRQVSHAKGGQTSPRLRKLSVSKMFTQLMSRNVGAGSSATTSGVSGGNCCTCTASSTRTQERYSMPRPSLKESPKKRGNFKHS